MDQLSMWNFTMKINFEGLILYNNWLLTILRLSYSNYYQYAKCYRASFNSITCTEQPTTPPSAAPITSSPMTSVATYAPTTDYDFIGDGNCLDGPTFDWSFSYFTNVAFNTGVNYSDDATSKTICSNICNEHTAPPYVGFETDVFYGSIRDYIG